MVPFTIFHRLSSLGSGGGVKAGTIPPMDGTECESIFNLRLVPCLVQLYDWRTVATVTTVTGGVSNPIL